MTKAVSVSRAVSGLTTSGDRLLGVNGWRVQSASNSVSASRTALLSLVETPKLRLFVVSAVVKLKANRCSVSSTIMYLRVIADELVAGARHGDARLEHALFEFSQPALTAAIGMGDQHADADAALHGGGERLLDLLAIDSEDREVDRSGGRA